MTPFGAKVRELRAQKGMTLKTMAEELHVSAAYLSALEHGKRGKPSPGLVMQICGCLEAIWDEAEELKRLATLSDPKVTLNTGGLTPEATELANRLAGQLPKMTDHEVRALLQMIKGMA